MQAQTFNGSRDGSAEVATNFAETTAVSLNGTNRFADDVDSHISNSDSTVALPQPMFVAPLHPAPSGTSTEALDAAVALGADIVLPESEVILSIDSLPSAIGDSNWKIRKEAYILLRHLLHQAAKGLKPGHLKANTIMEGLDDLVASIVADRNAGALDFGLHFAIDYANFSVGATSSSQAAAVVNSILKGGGFSASRGTTTKLCSILTLKLMEVGADGYQSVHSVINLLLEKGLASRKPKEVLATSAVILDAALDFGAGCLPLASIKSSASKILSHSNSVVRDTGLKIIAEICRVLGSKAPLQDVLDGLKKAQLSQLDEFLAAQEHASPPKVGLRNAQSGFLSTSGDALVAFEQQAKALDAERFANRPAVNLLEEIPRSDYSAKIKLAKWSEKVSALDALLGCGGEKPFKLVQPSSSVNYGMLVAEMRKLLSHTHFAVVSKTLLVIAMLAEGIGEKIFPNLRPLLTTILQLSKDKKLTKNAGLCVDSLFGNVLSFDNLLDKDDSVPSLLDEQKQKNALVRSSSLEFLCRCCERLDSAGPKGGINARTSSVLTDLCIAKLGDSDASARKAATGILRSLLSNGDPRIVDTAVRAVESLKSENPRVYAALKDAGTTGNKREDTAPAQSSSEIPSESKPNFPTLATTATTSNRFNQDSSILPTCAETEPRSKVITTKKSGAIQQRNAHGHESNLTNVDEAIGVLSTLHIPNLDCSIDDGGVLECLRDSKWQSRQKAVKSLVNYCESDEFEKEFSSSFSSAILFVVKEYTKGFKESNFNIVKAIMELMNILCGLHARNEEPFPEWASMECTLLCVDRISDKKLADSSQTLLSDLCTIRDPKEIIGTAFTRVSTIKAPATHEAFLKWMSSFCSDFGMFTLTADLKNYVPPLLKELENSNINVRKAAHSVLGRIHVELGPPFRALMLSSASDTIKAAVEAVCADNPFDPRAVNDVRPKRCIILRSSSTDNGVNNSYQGIEVPKTDLVAELGDDCIAKMGSREGKTAWKVRKEAMDEVDAVLKKCIGLISTTPSQLKALVDLLRALRERLTDSQSNLKPIAARLIGLILGSVEKTSQGTLGKLVFAPLLNAAINDGRKPMRDAALKALSDGTKAPELEGGEPNGLALESLMVAFVGEVGPTEIKAVGLPDLIHLITGLASYLPDLDSILGVRAQPVGEKFAATTVDCLASSKGETRTATEELLKACLEHGVISAQTLRTGINHLKPAQQRTVSPVISGLVSSVGLSSIRVEKENRPISDPSLLSRSMSIPSNTKVRATVTRPATLPDVSATASRSQLLSRKPEPFVREKVVEGHPLGSSSTGAKKVRINRKPSWPEYPEEPLGTTQLSSLKKLWTSLPSPTAAALFPEGGIKQQDDAHVGCTVLSKAIHTDSKTGSDEIIQHFDLILKWISISLCSREKTVGLQAILSLLMDLFTFLAERNYTMLDEEAFIIVPIVIEKASIAKGRFKEHFHDALSLLDSCGVISDKTLGSLICVTVIERSHQTKARVLAFQQCSRCIERIGLAGIGKKGLLLATKSLSEETLPENRTAVLDLLEFVLSKMDGDVDKLARICGSNLSDKSRALLEERCSRRGGGKIHDAHTKPPLINLSSRPKGRLVQPKAKSCMTSSRTEYGSVQHRTYDDDEGNNMDAAVTSVFRSSLDLRLGGTSVLSPHTSYGEGGTLSNGPFSFSFNPGASSSPMLSPDPGGETTIPLDNCSIAPAQSLTSTYSEIEHHASSMESPPSPTGAAASLRARLLKIRDKHRASDEQTRPVPQNSSYTAEKSRELISLRCISDEKPDREQKGKVFDQAMEIIEQLISKAGPLSDDDPDILRCISILKKFHCAISTPIDSLDSDLQALLSKIETTTTTTVESLTGVLSFAFTCGPDDKDAGMSVSLLSVSLATLMALFRHESLSRKVSQDALALLIRETGQALLDSRLSVSSHRASSLDESTSSQMVRAINKLAVQASTGSCRHVSLQALMALQQQLMLQETETPNDTAFNRRISRIVTKLFGKVIKAEQGEVDPFSSATVDIEALICALEDMLVSVYEDPRAATTQNEDARSTCESMATVLLQAMTSSRGSVDIRDIMSELEMDSTSHLSSLMDSVTPQAMNDLLPSSSQIPASSSPSKHASSKDVASLVSAVASSKDGLDRDVAVNNLRRHREQNGDEELNAHLSEVSATFRMFVLQHLNDIPPSTSTSMSPMIESTSSSADDRMAVSERLRNLRSKLNATESATIQAFQPLNATAPPSPHSRPHSIPSSPRRAQSSKIPPPKAATPSKDKSVSSLRQRLAAAQESRAKVDEGPAKSASGHAAALRARLEAVKQQHNK